MIRTAWIAGLVLVALPAGRAARAAPTAPPPGLRGERAPSLSDFSRRPPQPIPSTGDARLAQAQAAIREAGERVRLMAPDRRLLLLRAQRLLLDLTRETPRRARVWYTLGYAAHLLRDDDAMLRAWTRVWELDPDHWDTPDMSFAVGVVYAKRGDHAASVRVYRKGMAATPDLDLRGLLASNCAESTMALGDVPAALRLYEASARLRPRQNSAAYWGIMVASDRLSRSLAAEQAAHVALAIDPTLRGLTGPDVFFVPPGDVHYYLALAREHQGRLAEAAAEWRRFLAALPRSPHATRASEHLLRLRGAVAALRPRATQRWVDPFHLRLAVAPVTAELQRCWAAQRRGAEGLPEGRIRLRLTLQRDHLVRVDATGGQGPALRLRAALEHCLRPRLQNRRIAAFGRATIDAEFELELIP